MPEPINLNIVSLCAAFTARELDPLAVTEAYLARIAREDGALRSYITVAADSARHAAEASGRRFAEGRPRGPLDGVPIAIKDNIDVAGLPCTAGTAAFRDRIPAEDARVVGRLREQGAVILGKLNMHEGALGGTTDNPIYGCCMNPLQSGYTAGGSSGGSGAAVAARLCAAALGTDTMGSVRIPAAYCGVYGFKPTKGAMSDDGVVPLSFTLDSVGVLARSLEDSVVVARALLEPSPRALQALTVCDERRSLKGLRVGAPRQLEDIEIVPTVRSAFEQFLDVLRTADATVVPLDLPVWAPAKTRRAGLLISESEGMTYYTKQIGAELPGLSNEFASMLRYPTQAGLLRVISAYQLVEAVRATCIAAFADVDAIALPTAPQTSFPHDAEIPVNQADCTALANFARAPAITLPFAAEPLPIGMQIMAAPSDDVRLFEIARVVAQTLAPQLK